MPGRTARMVLKQPPMLRETISSNSSRVVATPVLPMGPEPPATLTRMSTPWPKATRAVSTAASQSAELVTSQAATTTPTPMARASVATGSMAAVSRPISRSLQPSAAKARVTAAPMPLAGPVIATTRPLRFKFMMLVVP